VPPAPSATPDPGAINVPLASEPPGGAVPIGPPPGPDRFVLTAPDIHPVQSFIDTQLTTPTAAVEWAVPAMALTVPGILVIFAVGAQSAAGMVWVPIVRRRLGGFGPWRRRVRGSGRNP
jgi:hypothetical protein